MDHLTLDVKFPVGWIHVLSTFVSPIPSTIKDLSKYWLKCEFIKKRRKGGRERISHGTVVRAPEQLPRLELYHAPPFGECLHKRYLLHKNSRGKDSILPILKVRKWRQRVVMVHESLDFLSVIYSVLCVF